MNIRGVLVVVGGMTGLLAAPALAQRTPRADNYPQHTQRIDISEGDEVTGETIAPGSTFVSARRPPRSPSLIKIRTNFVPEMLKSAEDR